MPTDIAPSLGQGAVLLQAGPGASPGYSAIDVRRALTTGLQEGVIDANSYEVTQRGAGANMTVDIAANSGQGAWVQGDTVNAQGLYFIAPHSAVINEVIAANSSGNPRVDQVVLEALDDTHDAGALNKARVRVLTGTATVGATLDNRTGATALPNGAIRLADVLVASGAVSVLNTSIRDRRPDARGAFYAYQRTAGTIALSGTAYQSLPASDALLGPRIENSGVTTIVTLEGTQIAPGTAVAAYVALYQDGVIMSGAERYTSIASGGAAPLQTSWTFTPTAASHTYAVYVRMTTTGGSVLATTTNGLAFSVFESVRQNARRNSVTSG